MRKAISGLLIFGALSCAQSPAADEPVAPASIEGAWRVEDIDHGGVVDNAEVTIVFGPDGAISGRSGCNRYGGEYAYAAGALTVGALFSTKMACAPALMDLEMKFLDRLDGELSVRTEADGALSLEDADGRILIRRSE